MDLLVDKLLKSNRSKRKFDRHATHKNKTDPTSTTPFRFMDLPKEVRLLVYENLDSIRCGRLIPLVGGHYICLDTAFVCGISILAVNRNVHAEASAMLAPLLRDFMKRPPKIRTGERNLTPFVSLEPTRHQFRRKDDLIDIILKAASHESTHDIIHQFRTKYSDKAEDLIELQAALGMQDIIDTSFGYGPINAIATFILRCVEYKRLYRRVRLDTSLRYPPIVIFLEIADFTSVQSIAVTKPRAQWLAGHFRAGSNRLRTVQYRTTYSLIVMIAHQRLRAADKHRSFSYLLALDYKCPIRDLDSNGDPVEVEEGVLKVSKIAQWAFQTCIKVSNDRYGKRGIGLVGDGGVGRDFTIVTD